MTRTSELCWAAQMFLFWFRAIKGEWLSYLPVWTTQPVDKITVNLCPGCHTFSPLFIESPHKTASLSFCWHFTHCWEWVHAKRARDNFLTQSVQCIQMATFNQKSDFGSKFWTTFSLWVLCWQRWTFAGKLILSQRIQILRLILDWYTFWPF